MQESLFLEVSRTRRSTSNIDTILKLLKKILSFQIKTIIKSHVKIKLSQIAQLADFVCNSETEEQQRDGIKTVIKLLESVVGSYSNTYLSQFSPVLNLLKQALLLPNNSFSVDLHQKEALAESDEPARKKVKVADKTPKKTEPLKNLLKNYKNKKENNELEIKSGIQTHSNTVFVGQENKNLPQPKSEHQNKLQPELILTGEQENKKNECKAGSSIQIEVLPSNTELQLEVSKSKTYKLSNVDNQCTKIIDVSSDLFKAISEAETLIIAAKTLNVPEHVKNRYFILTSILLSLTQSLQKYSVSNSNKQVTAKKSVLLQYVNFFSKDISEEELTILWSIIDVLEISVPSSSPVQKDSFSDKLMKSIISLMKVILNDPTSSRNLESV